MKWALATLGAIFTGGALWMKSTTHGSSAPGPTSNAPNAKAPVVLLPHPVALVSGKTYRARVGLSFAQNLIPNSAVIGALQKAGFANVRIIENAGQLPADWPNTMRSERDEHATEWAEADYHGPSQTLHSPLDTFDAWIK